MTTPKEVPESALSDHTMTPEPAPARAKSGPRPKQLQPTEVWGIAVGRQRVVVKPTDVFKLSELGLKDHEIATWFSIDPETLRYNFKAELAKGRESLKISLRRAMLDNAIKHRSAAVQIFLAKNMLGMSDSGQTDPDTGPLPWSD